MGPIVEHNAEHTHLVEWMEHAEYKHMEENKTPSFILT
jgi:hypothetical protein